MPLDKCELPPESARKARVDRGPSSGHDRAQPWPVLRRFAPVLQFVTKQRSDVAAGMNGVVAKGFDRGLSLEAIRRELIDYALINGFIAFIRIHEVRTDDMPSFPGQTILTGMLIVDLKPGPAATEMRHPA